MKYLAKIHEGDIKPCFNKPKNMIWYQFTIDSFFWKLNFIGLVLIVTVLALILIPPH